MAYIFRHSQFFGLDMERASYNGAPTVSYTTYPTYNLENAGPRYRNPKLELSSL